MEYTTLDKISENLDSMRKPITSSDRVEGEIPYYGASGIVDSVKDYIFDEPLLLVSEDGANLLARSTPIAFSITGKTWVNNHAHVLRFADRNLQKYVELYLNYISLESYVTGSAQPKLNQKKLNEIPIPVSDQDRIIQVVSTIEKISMVIEQRKQELQKLDELVKARFVEMFGDFRINSKGWQIASFNEIAIIESNMTTDYEKYANHPHIGIDSIEKDTGNLRGYRTVAEDGVISGKYVFTPKHIIYSKIRPNLNKVALPTFDGVCSADAYPILPIADKCNRVFLAYNMRSQFFLDYILQFCNRTNLPKVNRKEVCGFKTPLPPLELQNEFAAFVQQVDKSKSIVQKALDEAQLLFDSLMQEYFG